MLLTFENFHTRVLQDIEGLINDLADWTGRGGEEEADSWRQSLPAVSDAFRDRRFDALQLFFGSRGNCSLEYRLPASFSFSDVVLLGRQASRPSALFLELKHWQTRSDRPGPAPGLVQHAGQVTHHPSDQVKGYVDYCTHFHSAVQQFDASVSGCVAFTREPYLSAYRDGPNADLFRAFPCFSLAPGVDRGDFHDFIINRVNAPDSDFAQSFVEGRYHQRREFIRQLADQILHPDQQQFVLLDGQREAFQKCWHLVRQAVLQDPPRKTVIFIMGPPGCGKSVIAARLWASLAREQGFPEGNCVITTTSASQSSNWGKVMGMLHRGGQGIVKKANSYMPATMTEIAALVNRHPGLLQTPENWTTNLAALRALGHQPRFGDDDMLVSIIDEAHALINPEHRHGRGQFGFDPKLGPQAYHIIRGSLVSIFLLDPEQGFRTRENTTIGDMAIWAQTLGATVFDTIRLDGTQFRCGGSKEYVDWIDALWQSTSSAELRPKTAAWNGNGQSLNPPASNQAAEDPAPYQVRGAPQARPRKFRFDLVDSPFDLDSQLRLHQEEGSSVRLVASYAREWKTRKANPPHAVPVVLRDFNIPCDDGRVWSRVWNFAPSGDYTWFIQAPLGSVMHEDPLAEVGCSYAIRGFDYDYLGLLWLSDVVWRDNRWIVQPHQVFETGITGLVTLARNEANPDGPHHKALLSRMHQSYRILMTRAIKGLYVWFEDEETREHVAACLND